MLSAAQPARFTPTRKKPSIWLLLPVLLLVGLSLLPLLYVGTKAWQAGWSEALHLLWRPYVFGLMRNTLLLMVGVTVTCAVVGLSLAWLLERSNLQGRRLWGVILCLPFAVPAFVSSFTWVSLSASFEGLGGAILVMSLSKYPLIFLPVAATLRNLDPALEESARTLGQNRWGVFFNITLPLLWPSLLAGSLLIALHMLVEFGALSIIGLQTFTTAIYQQFELEFSNANAAMLSAVLVGLLVVRYKGPLAIWAERLPYLLHALPGLVIALALVYFALHFVPALYQTSALLLIAYALLFLPLAQAPIRTALNKAAPQLEEAARTLGATSFSAFCRVTLPIIFPALGAAFALVFLDAMKELTATLLLSPTGLNTLATQVWSHTSNIEFAAAAPYAALLILVSGLPVYLLTTRMYLSR